MSKVIMTHTNPDLVIGQIYKGLRGLKGEWLENQHYRVVAKSNARAYLDYLRSIGFDTKVLERMTKRDGELRSYYEIQTD